MRPGSFSYGPRSTFTNMEMPGLEGRPRIYTEGYMYDKQKEDRRIYNEDCRARIKIPFNMFNEDPAKAVFLSGFNTACMEATEQNEEKWAKYRNDVYQELKEKYNVYIRKFDLPKFKKSGYVHLKNKEQADFLLSQKEDGLSNHKEEGKRGTIKLNNEIIVVYPYIKTQTRVNNEVQEIKNYYNHVNTRNNETDGTTLTMRIPSLDFYQIQDVKFNNIDTNFMHNKMHTSTPKNLSQYNSFDFQSDITSDVLTNDTLNTRFKTLSVQEFAPKIENQEPEPTLKNQSNLNQNFKINNLRWSTSSETVSNKPINVNAEEFKPNSKPEKFLPKTDSDFLNNNTITFENKNDIYAGGDNQMLQTEPRPGSSVNNFPEIMSPHNLLSSFQNQDMNRIMNPTSNNFTNEPSTTDCITSQDLDPILNIITTKLRGLYHYENIENEFVSNEGQQLKTIIESLMNQCVKRVIPQQTQQFNYNFQNYGFQNTPRFNINLNQTNETNFTDYQFGHDLLCNKPVTVTGNISDRRPMQPISTICNIPTGLTNARFNNQFPGVLYPFFNVNS